MPAQNASDPIPFQLGLLTQLPAKGNGETSKDLIQVIATMGYKVRKCPKERCIEGFLVPFGALRKSNKKHYQWNLLPAPAMALPQKCAHTDIPTLLTEVGSQHIPPALADHHSIWEHE